MGIAALLEQERPKVFTQSIANIAAGEAIDVEIRYLQTLSYDAGEYEFVFPTVVGPRHAPRVALRGIEGPEGVALRRGLSDAMANFATCFEDAPRATYRVRRHATLRVVFAGRDAILTRLSAWSPRAISRA